MLDSRGEQTLGAKLRSAQARYAAHAAQSCGYSFRSLDGEDGYLFEVSQGARRAVFATGAGSPYALNDARAASIARDKAFCAEVLRLAGVPVVPGEMFFVTERWSDMRAPGREPHDALTYASGARYPVFCKPISASNGRYAERIDSPEAFAEYIARVSREHFAMLVQPYISAPEYRVFMLDGRPLFSYRKSPPKVTGDGRSSLSDLITGLMEACGHNGVERSRLSDHRGGFSPRDIIPAGEVVLLAGPANRSAGGAAAEFMDGASPELAAVAAQAAKSVGVRLAGVDLFDIDGQGPTVIEVNSNPMIATLEDHGRWDLITEIWLANFAAAMK